MSTASVQMKQRQWWVAHLWYLRDSGVWNPENCKEGKRGFDVGRVHVAAGTLQGHDVFCAGCISRSGLQVRAQCGQRTGTYGDCKGHASIRPVFPGRSATEHCTLYPQARTCEMPHPPTRQLCACRGLLDQRIGDGLALVHRNAIVRRVRFRFSPPYSIVRESLWPRMPRPGCRPKVRVCCRPHQQREETNSWLACHTSRPPRDSRHAANAPPQLGALPRDYCN